MKKEKPQKKKTRPLGVIIPNGVKVISGFRLAASQTYVLLFKGSASAVLKTLCRCLLVEFKKLWNKAPYAKAIGGRNNYFVLTKSRIEITPVSLRYFMANQGILQFGMTTNWLDSKIHRTTYSSAFQIIVALSKNTINLVATTF